MKERENWIDVFRGVAILGVFFEHWLDSFPFSDENGLGRQLADGIYRSGLLVHLFFFLSGFGLTRSLVSRNEQQNWSEWIIRRIGTIAVPFWIVTTITFLVSNWIGRYAPELGLVKCSISDLVWNLTFLRNQFPSSQQLNSSYWFMPVIVGLYLVFPVLSLLLSRLGEVKFAAVCTALNFASVAFAFYLGWDGDHQSSTFLFNLATFSLGMALGNAVVKRGFDLARFWDWQWLVTGTIVVFLSLKVTEIERYGSALNDSLTMIGSFLILFYVNKNIIEKIRPLSISLQVIGKLSFLFYLIHIPLVTIFRSLLATHVSPTLYSGNAILIGALVFGMITLLCWIIDLAIRYLSWKRNAAIAS